MPNLKPKDTLTGRDIREIPKLLADFSKKAKSSLAPLLLRPALAPLYLLGRGSSANAARFAKYIFEIYTGTKTACISPHSIFSAKKPLDFSASVVWAYSQSGKSPDIVECLNRLIELGAKGVSITNEPDLSKNLLAKAAGRNILLSTSPELPVAATKSFALQLWLSLHAAQIWENCFSQKDFELTINAIENLVAGDFFDSCLDYLPRIKNASLIGFIGRGVYSAIAADGALKFSEMANAHAIGYSAAEFLHGPVGAYSKGDFAFLLSPTEELPEDMTRVQNSLKLRGIDYAVLYEAKSKAPFNALLIDIRLKIIALCLALIKGLNPDSPLGLAKVTETH